MIALIIYLSTTVFFSISILIFLIPLLIFREVFIFKRDIVFGENELRGYIVLFATSVVMMFLNIFYGPVLGNIKDSSLLGDIPYIILIPFSFLLGKFINFKDLKIIQYLIALEIIVGVFEYMAGVPTFFRNNTQVEELAETGIFYQKRVFGFSPNSSTLAAKIIYLSMILMMSIKKENKINVENILFILFIIFGLFITFNRTAIIAIVFSFLILFGMRFKNLLLITVPACLLIYIGWDVIVEQLTRGRGNLDLSNRDNIFAYFINFINENMLLGNMGTKLWWNSGGSIWHAHNSYLEFIASNGIFSTISFLIGIMFIYQKKLIIALPILIFSFFQYGFLWGLSFYDVIFSAILYNYIVKFKN